MRHIIRRGLGLGLLSSLLLLAACATPPGAAGRNPAPPYFDTSAL